MTRIRPAGPAEAASLTELALRSKAHWGYGPEFMERCRPVLTVSPEYVRRHPIYVAEGDGALLGFYSLREIEEGVELDLMFVEPRWIGSGIGRLLLAHALERAAAAGHPRLLVESDPDAEAFYVRFGASRVGARASTVEAGRSLPLLAFDLAPWRGAAGPLETSST